MALCEVAGLKKTYPSFALSDMTFRLEAGRIVGFIGRNGAGKTTTIKAMLGLVHPDGGEVRYFGLPFSGHEKEIKQRIGYSAGAVNYYPRKKIRDIAAVTKTFFDTWDQAAYGEYRALFALDEDKTPSELSEGMRVKFSLLLALSHKAEILILDEPTSGLDPFSRDELLEIFANLKKRGASILFSTHITSDIEKCADDILYIRGGKLAANCSKEDFARKICKAGESIEQAILRLERGGRRMMALLKKEMKLAASPLSYLFIASGLMAFIPGYPILVSSFFLCLGLFQSFQAAREANDLTYTALLPVAKADAVRAKYLFCGFVELCYFALTAAVTLLRMTALSEAGVYRSNPLMNANLAYLGFVLLILGLFQSVFVGGFFRTAYRLAGPFAGFAAAAFLVVGLGETLFHIPGMEALNAFGFERLGVQLGVLLLGLTMYFALTLLSMHRAIVHFERVDL